VRMRLTILLLLMQELVLQFATDDTYGNDTFTIENIGVVQS
jgi:hypothetical protein